MKKLVLLIAILFVFSAANAEIGWSGQIWPNSGTDHTNGSDIDVYYQIWKDGVTNLAGQGDSISATLYYKQSDDTNYESVSMTYNGDVGDNDEYMGTIPNSFFYTGDAINFYCEGYDSTDGTYSYGTDQAGAGPFDNGNPGTYNIIAGLNQNVTVTFNVYLGYEDPASYSGGVSIQGGTSPLDWTPGSTVMTDADNDDIYTVDVEFAAGSNPNLEFKFTKSGDGGATWQWEEYPPGGNRTLTLDDSSPTQVIDPALIYGNTGTLPVELASFTASYMDNGNTLIEWTTATETDVQGFNLYRGMDNEFGTANRINVDMISGNGTTSEPNNYYFQDIDYLNPNSTYYYWLESVDYGGASTIYNAIEFVPDEQQGGYDNTFSRDYLGCYPNPTRNNVKIDFAINDRPVSSPVTVTIYNILGEVVRTENITSNDNEIDLSNFNSGVYFYQIKETGFNEIKKLVVIN